MMKKTLIASLLSVMFWGALAQAGENCEGFSPEMTCFEPGTPAHANVVNANFKALLDQIAELKAALSAAGTSPGTGNGNVSYIRWGRKTCPESASLIYKGYAASGAYNHMGGISSNVCLTDNPVFANEAVDDGNQDAALLYGTEYETASYGIEPLKGLHDFEAPCAVCLKQAAVSLMIPGTTQCPADWNKEYEGYLMGTRYNQSSTHEVACVDVDPEKVKESDSAATNENGNLWYPTEAECGALPCPPYVQNRELSCVVCTK